MHTRSCSPSSVTVTPFISYQFSKHAPSSESRSPSPWSDDMTPSVRRDGDIEMTDSPASSCASVAQPSPTRYNGEDNNATSSRHSSTSLSTYSRPQSPARRRSSPLQSRRGSGKKAAKNPTVVSKEREKVVRNARVRELKLKALGINKGRISKEPAPDHQREVLRMVYDQITPYPDEAWIAQLAVHFNWYVAYIAAYFLILMIQYAADTTRSRIGFLTLARKTPVISGLNTPTRNTTSVPP